MPRRATIAGIATAIASIIPLGGIAQAQDLDCRNFTFQEDAQAVFGQDPSDPHRLDEDQGPDDGIACEALPRRATTLTTPT
ncbi:excalibur calcium-binding protein, partial [Streptomyces spongiae]|nr:excalibur calcium-binding protein [Streptomyces spongiae]